MSERKDKAQKELDDLTEQLVRLRQFMATDEYHHLSGTQYICLIKQSQCMADYADVLIERLGDME